MNVLLFENKTVYTHPSNPLNIYILENLITIHMFEKTTADCTSFANSYNDSSVLFSFAATQAHRH